MTDSEFINGCLGGRRQRIRGGDCHDCIIHIDIIEDKIWIQYDGTEEGIALELTKAGVPQENLVLAFYPPDVRPYTDYAIA